MIFFLVGTFRRCLARRALAVGPPRSRGWAFPRHRRSLAASNRVLREKIVVCRSSGGPRRSRGRLRTFHRRRDVDVPRRLLAVAIHRALIIARALAAKGARASAALRAAPCLTFVRRAVTRRPTAMERWARIPQRPIHGVHCQQQARRARALQPQTLGIGAVFPQAHQPGCTAAAPKTRGKRRDPGGLVSRHACVARHRARTRPMPHTPRTGAVLVGKEEAAHSAQRRRDGQHTSAQRRCGCPAGPVVALHGARSV